MTANANLAPPVNIITIRTSRRDYQDDDFYDDLDDGDFSAEDSSSESENLLLAASESSDSDSVDDFDHIEEEE